MAGRPGLWACRPGRVLEGTLGWAARAGKGTTARRDTPLLLAGRYTCHWRNYSEVSLANGRIALFRYLLISHVPGQTDSAQAQAAHPSQVGKRPQTATEPAVPLTARPAANSAREEILAAARMLANRSPDGSFTLTQIITNLRRAGTCYAESTIRDPRDLADVRRRPRSPRHNLR
jgi:hypothetical protein